MQQSGFNFAILHTGSKREAYRFFALHENT